MPLPAVLVASPGAPAVTLAAGTGTGTGTGASGAFAPSPTSPVVHLGPTYQAGNGDLVDFWGIGVALVVILVVVAVVRWAFGRTGAVSEGPRDDRHPVAAPQGGEPPAGRGAGS